MVLDPVTGSILASATVSFFKPILEKLATDVATDGAKTYIKRCFKSVFCGEKSDAVVPDVMIEAGIQGTTLLLANLEKELTESLDAGEAGLPIYKKSVEIWLQEDNVTVAINMGFKDASIDEMQLYFQNAWVSIPDVPAPPDDFSWKKVARLFLNEVKAYRACTPELLRILSGEATITTAEMIRQSADLPLGFDLEKFKQALIERFSRLPNVDCLSKSAYGYNYMRLWSIFVPQMARESQEFLPQTLEIPKEHLKRMVQRGELEEQQDLREGELEKARRRYIESRPRSVLDVVTDPSLNRLVLLGDPGAGKSSLLRWIALQWARLDAHQLAAHPIPLLIELKDYSRWECTGLKSFRRYWSEAPGVVFPLDERLLEKVLRRNRGAVLLLDGLDEIFDPQARDEAVNAIHQFSIDYQDVPIIVTSRVYGFKRQPFLNSKFHIFMLQDFEEREIVTFLENWHQQAYEDPNERKDKLQRLKTSIDESERIRELAGNPLLLTMMAILNRSQILPRGRTDLYDQCTRVLLDLWDTEAHNFRDYLDHEDFRKLHAEGIDYKDKRSILQTLAFTMQTAGNGEAGNIIHEEMLQKILENYLREQREFVNPKPLAKALIEQLRARNFALCPAGASYYAFVHRTFMEYYCAAEILERFEKRRTLEEEDLINGIFGRYWNDEAWLETLCLLVGMLDEAIVANAVGYLLQQPDAPDNEFRHIFLAAQCFLEVRRLSVLAVHRDAISRRLESLSHWDFPFYYKEWEEKKLSDHRQRIRVKTISAFIGIYGADPSILSTLCKDWLQQDGWEFRAALIQIIARTWHHYSDTLVWLKLSAEHGEDWTVRRTSLEELVRGWKDDPDTLTILKRQAEKDEDEIVRHTAIERLAREWKEDPDTLPILKRHAEQDKEWIVRHSAIQELAYGWKDDPSTLSILKHCAEQDEDSVVRGATIRELTRLWKGDPDTLTILKRAVIQDQSSSVRRVAIQELACHWKDDPNILPFFKHHAERDPNGEVRQVIIQELAIGWKGNADTLPFIKRRAEQDKSYNVRRVAIIELSHGWKDDPDTLPFLKRRAEQDESTKARRVAIQELARGWKEDPDTLPYLKRRAEQDESKNVRRAAILELAYGWKDDPDTLPILKRRAEQDKNNGVRREAIQELARGWKDDPDTLLILKRHAEQDENNYVRRAAIQELARHWKDDPGTLPILKRRVEYDEENVVRQAAIQGLVRGWKDTPDILPILKLHAEHDEDSSVRRAAIMNLVRGWKDDPDTLSFLKRHAKQDQDLSNRRMAIWELKQGWKNDIEVQQFINQLKETD